MRTTTIALAVLLLGGCEDLPFEVGTGDDTVEPSDTCDVDRVDVMLPMNGTTLGAAYLYCVNQDRDAMQDLLRQMIEYAGAPVENPNATARDMLQDGYCTWLIGEVESEWPEVRASLRDYLLDQGLDLREPISDQTEPETHASIFGAIWGWLKDLFTGGGGGGGGSGEKHIHIEGEVNAPIYICTEITVTENPSDPEPFYPDPPPRG